jgi:hypothetical protein
MVESGSATYKVGEALTYQANLLVELGTSFWYVVGSSAQGPGGC